MRAKSGLVVIIRPPAIALHPTPPEAPAERAPLPLQTFEMPAFYGGIRIQLFTKKNKQKLFVRYRLNTVN